MAEFLMITGLIFMFFSGFTMVKTIDNIGGLGFTIMIIVFALGLGMSYVGYNLWKFLKMKNVSLFTLSLLKMWFLFIF